MKTISTFPTYWEIPDGRQVELQVTYEYFPPVSRGTISDSGIPMREAGEYISILNIRTADGQDPILVILDWDREYAVQVLSEQILLERNS